MKMTKAAKKIGKVMGEFKSGKLHSGMGGKVVKNPKQAIAIGLSEAGMSKKKGGGMAESKKMVGKEVSFMKKKGAPKSMIKHEEAEMAGMKYKTLMPTHYCKRPEGERWFLHSYGEYGIGTHFEGGVFHLYQGRLPQNQTLFKRVCGDIIKGKFSTEKMKDCREI